MRGPSFSIVTVCLNAAATIRQTLDSVRDQAYPGANIQHVVVDGGSRDGTCEIVAEAHRAGHVATFVCESDSGIYDAMNKGLALARGDLVAFLNADDWYAPNALSSVADVWNRVEVDYLFGDAMSVDGNGENPRLVCANFERFIRGAPYCHQSLFCSRNWMERLGGFSRQWRISGDMDFMWRLLASGARPCHLRRALVFCRQGGANERVPHFHENVGILAQQAPTLNRLLRKGDGNHYAACIIRSAVRALRCYDSAGRQKLLEAVDDLLGQIDCRARQGLLRRKLATLALNACKRTPGQLPSWVSPVSRLAAFGSHRLRATAAMITLESVR